MIFVLILTAGIICGGMWLASHLIPECERCDGDGFDEDGNLCACRCEEDDDRIG